MSKVKFQFDKRTLTYRKVEIGTKQVLFRVFGYLAAASVFAVLVVVAFTTFFDSPKEKQLARQSWGEVAACWAGRETARCTPYPMGSH